MMRETEQAVLALHTKSGSPRTSVFIAEKLRRTLEEYDRFIEFVCELRKKIKDREDKNEIMRLVNSDEFFDLFMQNKHQKFCEQWYKV
jgi:precorrin-2 dehydrogenase/sirohydrochlorin ferrochelatase